MAGASVLKRIAREALIRERAAKKVPKRPRTRGGFADDTHPYLAGERSDEVREAVGGRSAKDLADEYTTSELEGFVAYIKDNKRMRPKEKEGQLNRVNKALIAKKQIERDVREGHMERGQRRFDLDTGEEVFAKGGLNTKKPKKTKKPKLKNAWQLDNIDYRKGGMVRSTVIKRG